MSKEIWSDDFLCDRDHPAFPNIYFLPRIPTDIELNPGQKISCIGKIHHHRNAKEHAQFTVASKATWVNLNGKKFQITKQDTPEEREKKLRQKQLENNNMISIGCGNQFGNNWTT